MRSHPWLFRSPTVLSSRLSGESTERGRSVPRPSRLYLLAIVSSLASFVPQALSAQQGWPQSPQYPNPQYVQSNPNYIPYQQNQQQPYPQQEQAYPQQQYTQQPYTDPGQNLTQSPYDQSQQGGQPFAAEQLEQLVAPIALYPDSLVAQILAASTYPAQVAAADNWLRAQGYASPDQIAYGANAQTNWDPSIKALTAVPQVLDMMNRDLRWTTDLGNAYYNQPQDVLGTIQVMRQRAQTAGTLESTPQEAVSYNQGYIQLAPTNPQVVYVPAYNPWTAYGQPVSPYPGFSFINALGAVGSFLGTGMRFGAGIGMAAFSHTPFGWAGWVLNWLTSSIFFHQSPYYSHSTSVAHWAAPRGGSYGSQMGGINRTPNGYPRPQQGYERLSNNYADRGFSRPSVRTPENYAYGRPQPQVPMAARPETYARPSGYGSSAFGAVPGRTYASPQQSWRAPAPAYQRNDFAQRSFADSRANSGGRGFAESGSKPEHANGFHMFGGNHGEQGTHASYRAPRAPKAPRMSGGGHHGGGLFHHGR
jgi:hypothetical protein